MLNKIDHIVWACQELPTGIGYIEQITGVRPSIGGRHINQGTHNAILPIGSHCYLEIIAPDPSNIINGDAWMAVNQINKPCITRWAIHSNNLASESLLLNAFEPQMSNITTGYRELDKGKNLKWKMTLPGRNKIIEPAPFLIDWTDSVKHPCDSLPHVCELLDFQITCNTPSQYIPLFEKLNLSLPISKGDSNSIFIKIKTPKGILNIQ